MGSLEDLDTLTTNGRLEDLDTMFRDALEDPSLMPALVDELRRLMHDPVPEIRTVAAGIAFSAVRRLLSSLSPLERVALSDAVSIDLDAAFNAGLADGTRMSRMWTESSNARVLRAMLRRYRERRDENGEIP